MVSSQRCGWLFVRSDSNGNCALYAEAMSRIVELNMACTWCATWFTSPTSKLDYSVDGRVTLAFMVDAQGKPSDMRIVESSGNSDLDRASARAAKSCSFKAAVRNGNAVPGLARVRYTWVVQ